MAKGQNATGWQAMGDADIMQADRDALVDIRDIHIDSTEPVETKIRAYIRQAHDPFMVKYGDYIIKLSYADTEKTMDDRMREYVAKMAERQYRMEEFK